MRFISSSAQAMASVVGVPPTAWVNMTGQTPFRSLATMIPALHAAADYLGNIYADALKANLFQEVTECSPFVCCICYK
jgi:hypothetical protein